MIDALPVLHASDEIRGKYGFESAIREITEAIRVCNAARLHVPAMMILYAGIDVMSQLDRAKSKSQGTWVDYVRWAREYVIQGSSLECTAEELYSARCGYFTR